MSDKPVSLTQPPAGYADWLADLKGRIHTAQQRASAALLCVLPIVVAIGFWFAKPEYMRLLWEHPTGSKFLTYAICSEIVGILVIRKVANIKV